MRALSENRTHGSLTITVTEAFRSRNVVDTAVGSVYHASSKLKGNFNIENGSILISAQNNAIRTNYIKAKIYKTQQNSKSRLCDDRDEKINHIISKLAQKEYQTRHNWVGEDDQLGIVQEI